MKRVQFTVWKIRYLNYFYNTFWPVGVFCQMEHSILFHNEVHFVLIVGWSICRITEGKFIQNWCFARLLLSLKRGSSCGFLFCAAQPGFSLVDRIHAMDFQCKQNKCVHMCIKCSSQNSTSKYNVIMSSTSKRHIFLLKHSHVFIWIQKYTRQEHRLVLEVRRNLCGKSCCFHQAYLHNASIGKLQPEGR